MKILQINCVYNIGSTGRSKADFQKFTSENTDYICKTAFSYGGTADDGYIVGNKLDRKIHGVLSRFLGKQAWFSHSSTKKLLKFIDEFSPDIIQLGNLHGNFINFPMLMKYIAKKDIATVLTLHDCWFFTAKCCHYINDDCYRWQTGCYDCPRLKQDNPSWFMDKTPQLWKEKRELFGAVPRLAVVGVSEWTAYEAKKSPLMENAKIITHIYNGIDEKVFKPTESNIREKYGLENKKIILGVSSGWLASKGLFEIIELSEMLPEDCQIVLVGNMPDNLPKCNILNIPATENVEELVKWYSVADVFINMSKAETFGKVSAEALMCGTPVVCLDNTASPELIGDNCGYVCESDNVEDFKKYVMKVLENGKSAYSDSCLTFARNNFTVENNYREYLNLYSILLGE